MTKQIKNAIDNDKIDKKMTIENDKAGKNDNRKRKNDIFDQVDSKCVTTYHAILDMH